MCPLCKLLAPWDGIPPTAKSLQKSVTFHSVVWLLLAQFLPFELISYLVRFGREAVVNLRQLLHIAPCHIWLSTIPVVVK